jgi:type IV pilus assembly protein PilO
MRDTVAALEAATDSAKKELARGTVADVRKRLETYRSSLVLLRRLVPERNEVPNLLDDISTRSKIRGVTLSQVIPLAPEAGPAPFDTYKYNMSVIGHYDQIGQFMADVASLQRIIVPYDLTVASANQSAARALGDSTGAMLEAKFQIRTYVKSPNSQGAAPGGLTGPGSPCRLHGLGPSRAGQGCETEREEEKAAGRDVRGSHPGQGRNCLQRAGSSRLIGCGSSAGCCNRGSKRHHGFIGPEEVSARR